MVSQPDDPNTAPPGRRDQHAPITPLNAWRLILARAERQVPTRWVELVAAQPVPTARYVVRVGGVAIELGDHFRDDTLRRLLAVVASC